jgi:DNA-binding response OmpR family regulator/class 3 adenylate cyclase
MNRAILILASDVEHRSQLVAALRSLGWRIELAESYKRALELVRGGGIKLAVAVVDTDDERRSAFASRLTGSVEGVIFLKFVSGAPESKFGAVRRGEALLRWPDDEQALRDRVAEFMNARPDDVAADPPGPAALEFGGGALDLRGRSFRSADGRSISLSRAEFDLLAAFLRRPGRVLSRDQLRRLVAGRGVEAYDRSVDMLVARLRRKIEPKPKAPRYVVTIEGLGYRFADRVRALEDLGEGRAASAEPPEPPAERRPMTVLACQIVGLAGLSVSLDPEDLRSAMNETRLACAAIIERFHGRLANFIGGNFLAYFGFPATEENDSERAIAAGLELSREAANFVAGLEPPLRMRIGIGTGSMLIAPPALDAHTTFGEAQTVAIHVQSLAAPGEVLVATGADDKAVGAFEFEDPRWVDLGAGAPRLRVRRVSTGSSSTRQSHRVERGELVDREEECELLRRRWKRARNGAGSVVLIKGEPGIGKSSLIRELENQIAAESHVKLVYSASPQDTIASFAAIADELRRAAEFKHGDTPQQMREKLESFVAEAGEQEEMTLFCELLGLPTSATTPLQPQLRRRRIFAAIERRIERLTGRLPVLVICEDMHWMDQTSLELFANLVGRAVRTRLLIVGAARPEFSPAWSSDPHVSTLSLARFGEEHSRALVEGAIEGAALPEAIHRRIWQRAEGVPLYLVELAKAVLEADPNLTTDAGTRGIRDLPASIPRTLHGPLHARLDRLGPGKEVARIGAGIGREFSLELLRAVAAASGAAVETGLERLVASGLVLRRGVGAETMYAFKHILIRDAAYEMLPRDRRQELHSRIARCLETGFPETAAAQPELLAHHHQQAGSPEKAVSYLLVASGRALLAASAIEAIALGDTALRLLAEMPESDVRRKLELKVQVALARAFAMEKDPTAAETRAAYARAQTLASNWTTPKHCRGSWSGSVTRRSSARNTDSERCRRKRCWRSASA